MKASELKHILSSLPDHDDPVIVTGEEWLPEQLVDARRDGELLFLNFDSAPEDIQGEEEGRGFVEHEIDMIHLRLKEILDSDSDSHTKADAMLALLLAAHEKTSSEVIELLETD
ncbi:MULTISPECIES: hypothetical protein [Vibrio]|uniref:hypothetical protein n=1 Tax=Vibrio TaxID=662 RepID=UPI00059386AE|nr:hypothetical protein [Vibrio proteolyticus]NAW57149.1 hypothetical protein [Vibrio sp. V36_P2S2PM302]NAX22293.1 hypothetical protein [Vibrio sp. V39_P1S14PM300]NAX24556.1 hypothetical protein [Vibrio sp. V38_P2S17PM301]NAX30333.1 hypothetical protein [Vibrio sp. V37_P2S8PM304]